ncbi:MAG: choice-of-anchor D domain-containing protein [Candidatus Kapaibacterium sp.]
MIAQIGNHFQLSQRTLTFDTTCGTTQCREVVLRNVSNNPISIVALNGPGGSFSLDPSTPLVPVVTIAGRDSLRVRYCFSPTAVAAAENDRVLITVDTGDDPNFAVDTLRFTGRSRGPRLSIDPPTINFGNVTVGQQSCITVNVRNDGDQPFNIATLNQLAFPFSPATFPPLLIPPGTLTQVEVCFTPINSNSFRDTLTIENGGCGDIPTLIVQGRGLDSVANIGPVLQLVPPTFDTTLCGTTECRTLVVRNVGTDPLDLTGADNIPAPFAGSIRPLPITIAPNQERTFTLCYAPTEPQVRDTATIFMVADNRVSLSIATVFDVSGSMTIRDFNGLTRIEAAHDAGVSFLGNLINDPGRGVVDEGAVYQFSDPNNIQRLAGYTSDIPTLQGAVPTTASGGTCLYQAVVTFSNELATRNIPGRRVMIVLADGDNSCATPTSLQEAITAAQNAGVRVYTIGIGNANTTILSQLASSTGGFFSEAVSPIELLQAYQRIANSLSQNQTTSFTMTGQSVAPNMEINPTSIDFDSVRVGQNRCETVTITNTGDAPLNINDLLTPSEHYSVNPTTFAPILPNQSVNVQICFEPTRLRHLDSTFTFPFVRCVADSRSVAVTGIGYDSVVIAITGNFTARPESVISIPVRLLNRIPENYELDSLELTFQYNKTMLFPQPERNPLLLPNTLSAPMTDQDAERSFTPTDALLRVTLDGGRIVNPTNDSLLTNLGLIVLHGNALVTPVDIISARFADGNPKVGIVSTAQFTADSLCFQERRLIDASARFGPVAKLLSQGQDFAVVQITLDQDATIRAELYDPLGRFAGRVLDGVREEGTYELTIDLRNLPAGPYLLRTMIGTDYQLVTPILH